MKIVLLGANGQLGKAFQGISKSESFPIGWELKAFDRNTLDLSSPEAIEKLLNAEKPSLIINAAAYTQVDLAEKEIELSHLVNHKAPEVMAKYSSAHNVPLVHFSTDYVYRGDGTQVHQETDAIDPQSQYGRSKAKGDESIAQSGCDFLIFRTSWVYSFEGKNFVKTMQRLAVDRPELKVVNDQVGSPTYAPDLAMYALEAVMRALESKTAGSKFPSGVYHLSNSGFTTWADFAKAIVSQTKVVGIPSSEYPTPAKRPLNSRLSLEKFTKTFGVSPRSWQEALKDCLKIFGVTEKWLKIYRYQV